MWFDTHCHLSYLEDKLAQAVTDANDKLVTHMVTIGCAKKEWDSTSKAAANNKNVWASAGIHPHEAKNGIEGLEAELEKDKIVAVGECGLDYYYDHSPRDKQMEVFANQIELAKKTNKALVIHTRDAWDDTFKVIDECGLPERTVLHCFSGGPDEAKKCLDRGAYISFSGIVTFPKATDVADAAKIIPTDRIVIETDTPYLAPVPLRGQTNSPANVAVIGEFLAGLRSVSVTEFSEATMANSFRLFGL